MNKICTSIEQSKKLKELGLGFNTADMYYDVSSYGIQSKPEVVVGKVWTKDIPAWSLSALLKVIPKHIKNVNTLRIDIDEKDFSIWYDEIGHGVNTELPDITMENPVDACYELILKLHKQNLL